MKGPFNHGDLVGGKYKIISFIGEGGMQYVYEALDVYLHRKVALKTPKNISGTKRFHRSAILSGKINHPNVAKTYDYFVENEKECLVEELVDGKDLSEAILKKSNYLDPHFVAKLFHNISKGLAASHHNNIIHRDLKPSNIMISGGFDLTQVKITDFGVSKLAKSEMELVNFEQESSINASATAVGAIPYMAPEAIDDDLEIDLKIDIWSIGAMMYEFLCGTKPFGQGLVAVRNIIDYKRKKIPSFVTSKIQFKGISLELIKIINSCLSQYPNDRPSADKLVEMFTNLCYSTHKREVGYYRVQRGTSFGFLRDQEGDVFFHYSNVYGELPKIGDEVMFSKYDGGGSDRAIPVVRLKQPN